MAIVLKVLGSILFLLCQPVAILLAALTLPGSVLVLVSAILFSAATGWHRPSLTVLVVLGVLTLAAELLDNLMALVGVKWYGGRTRTSIAAGFGAITGAVLAGVVLSPLVGLLGGPVGWVLAAVVVPLAGAIAGGFGVAYLVETHRGSQPDDARRAGIGAIVGRVLGAVSKVILTSAMAVMAVIGAFWPAASP